MLKYEWLVGVFWMFCLVKVIQSYKIEDFY